jgi:hypothetical protein
MFLVNLSWDSLHSVLDVATGSSASPGRMVQNQSTGSRGTVLASSSFSFVLCQRAIFQSVYVTLHFCRAVMLELLCQVDVMVNTTSADLNLKNGAISRSILTAAGPMIQAECQQKAPAGVSYGDIVETSGCKLRCTSVYHGACQKWDNGDGAM